MDNLPINVTDLVVIVVILLSAIFALVRGFVHEVLAVGAWLGAALATLFAFPFAQPFTRQYIAIPLVADIATGAAIFLVVLVALSILTHWISGKVQESSLGPLDRSLGLLFGLARGAILVCLAWIFLVYIMPRQDHPRWINEARSLPLVEQGAGILLALVPRSLLPAGLTVQRPAGTSGGASFDKLIAPAPKGAAQDDASGYKDGERKDLQRLIDSTQ